MAEKLDVNMPGLDKDDKLPEITNPVQEDTEVYYTDMYKAWETKEQLRIWQEVAWSAWWWSFYVWNTTITATWSKAVTWVWFQPGLVTFAVADWSWSASFTWVGAMTTTTQNALNNTNSGTSTADCIYYHNPVKTRAQYTSMDSDWFTINVSVHTSWTTLVNFIAYK